ncbi:MAG: 2-oxoacid:acceptor oxidoreductase family protein [Peptococcaceae bacterium]|nr:2-oxoacid:acceptor oxidoreductase family protein [Peptococcaceae bacterium]
MARSSEIILSGAGGQGLLLAGRILAGAAVMDGKNTVQTQSYGPEARGGASRAEVIISEGEIDYPRVTRADILLVMSQQALSRHLDRLSAGGILMVDATHVRDVPPVAARVFALPYSRMAREALGKEMVASVVALGALAALTGVVSRESLRSALLSLTPPGTEALNLKALELGWRSARQAAA